MPVFNESTSIRAVVSEWIAVLSTCVDRYLLVAIDDGSRDDSFPILTELSGQFHPNLLVLKHENRGHGQSCLAGYRLAISQAVPWILQIDSDGQCDPRYFPEFWQHRVLAVVHQGMRVTREDGFIRLVASRILRLWVVLAFRVDCRDPNVPYRLMQTAAIQAAVTRIPAGFDLANIALAVILKRTPQIAHRYIDIGFRQRYGGASSQSLKRFVVKAFELHSQLRSLLKTSIRG